MADHRRLRALAAAAGTAAILAGCTAALLALVLLVAGHDPVRAIRALLDGAAGTPDAFASATLVRAIPLALAGLAVALAFRAGIFNIGADGQLLAGAAAASAVALPLADSLGGGGVVAALSAAALAGGAWASVAAQLRRRFGVLEVISTIMLNFVALHLVSWLVRGPLQEPLRIYPQTAPLADGVRLPGLVPGTRLHAGVLLALLAAGALWWALRHTAAGFRVRAIGANPDAARVAGEIDVPRTTFRVFVISGALAGLAGGVEVTGVTYALYENLSPGYGYTAIAVALLARLHPLALLLSATLFGALEAGAAAMQRDAGVPSVLVSIVEACLILLALTLERLRARQRSAVSSASPETRPAAAGAVA